MQKLTDAFIKKIDEHLVIKEAEIDRKYNLSPDSNRDFFICCLYPILYHYSERLFNNLKRFFLFFFLFSIYTNAQHTISGSVRNESINKPLAFATVRLSDGKTIIADVDGKFTIENTTGLDHFSVSYSGFETSFRSS